MAKFHFRSDVLTVSKSGRKSTGLRVVLENVIFLKPLFLQPGIKFFEGCEGDVGNFEAAPVHVNGRGVTVNVGGAEGVYVLSVLSISAEGSMLV